MIEHIILFSFCIFIKISVRHEPDTYLFGNLVFNLSTLDFALKLDLMSTVLLVGDTDNF